MTPPHDRRRFAPASLVAGAPVFRPGTSASAGVAPWVPEPGPGPTAAPTSPRRRRLRRTLAFVCAEGMGAELFNAFVGGSVLTAWALFLGCGPMVIALLGALPFLAQVLQFPAAWATSHFGPRRVTIAGFAVGRLAWAPLVALPFLPASAETRRTLLLAVAACAAVGTVVGTNAWSAWMGDVVPELLRGRFFGKRLSLVTTSGGIGALGAGLLLDFARGGWQPWALAGLALLACVAGLFTLFCLLQQQDVSDRGRPRPAAFEPRAILGVLRDPATRPLLHYQIAWNAALGVSGAFFSIFMIENLALGFALVALHGLATAAVRVLVSPHWGRLIDRFGARPVLVLCSFALAIVPLLWLLPTAESFLLALTLDVLLAGSLWTGHVLASFELPLAVAPRKNKPYYLAAFAAAGGVAFTLSSAVGGALAQILPAHLHVAGGTFANLQLLFLLSAVGRLLAAPLALGIAERRSHSVAEMGRELVTRMRLGPAAPFGRVLAFARGQAA